MTGPRPDLSQGITQDEFYDWLFPKRPESYSGTPGQKLRQLLAERRADRARREATAFAPDVSKAQLAPPSFPVGGEPPPTLQQERTDYDRQLAQREADRLQEEAQARKRLMGTLGPVGRTAFAAGRGVAELASAPAALAGRETPGISEPLRHEARLEQEGLIKPGEGEPTKTEEMAGGFLGTLPAFEVGAAVTGPVTRALTRRLVQRGVGKLGSLGERAAVRGAEGLVQRGAELSVGSGIQGTAAGLGRGENVPEALGHGAEAAASALDPRHPLIAALLAHGALAGAVRGAGEHVNYRERLRALGEERGSRLLGFGPVLPEESIRMRGEPTPAPTCDFVYSEPGRPERAHLMPPPGAPLTPLDVEAQKTIDYLYERHRDVFEPGLDAELTPEQLTRRERLRREIAVLNELRRQPEAGRPLPSGAPKVLGGTAEELARRAPRAGEPGVLGSGPLLGGSTPELLAGAAGAAAGVYQGETTEDKILGALLGATIGSGTAASLRGRGGRLASGPLVGGPEAPFYSRLRRTLEALPENGASPQRLEALSRSGAFAKAEYDYVLQHQLEGREPNKLIPRAELLRMHDAEALQLTGTTLPTKPAPDIVERQARVTAERREAQTAMEEHRDASYHLWETFPPGAREWFRANVAGHVQEPDDFNMFLGRYERVSALNGTRVKWKTVAIGAHDSKVRMVIKQPGRPPIVRSGYDAPSILARHGDDVLRSYVRDNPHSGVDFWGPDGTVTVNAPPIPEAAFQDITANIAQRQAEYQELKATYRQVYLEEERLANEAQGRRTVYSDHGADESRAGKPANYREYLVQMHRSGPPRYSPPHFGEGGDPDLLFHVRGDERIAYNTETGAPEKVLFLRELQSDYFQLHGAGGRGMIDRRTNKIIAYPRGFEILPQATSEATLNALPPDVKRAVTRVASTGTQTLFERQSDGSWKLLRKPSGEPVTLYNDAGAGSWVALRRSERGGRLTGTSSGSREQLQEEMNVEVRTSGVPRAPWRQTEDWTKLAIRHVVQQAATEGFRHIVWTPGALNQWAADHGFADFYSKVLPRAFRDVGKELGVELSFEPAPLTRKVTNWGIEAVEPDALTPERVASAWNQVTHLNPTVIQHSQTLRQVIGALDHLFNQTPEGQYQPIRANEEIVHSVTREQVDNAVREMINGDYPNNGEKIWNALNGAVELPATFDRETLHRILVNSDANGSSQRTLLTRLNLVGDRPLSRRSVGAQSHEVGAVRPLHAIKIELQATLKSGRLTDQAKVALLNLLGAKRVEGFEYGPRYHSVRLPENISQQLAGGQRLMGGVPFDPEWLKAVGLPAATAAIGAGVGIATAPAGTDLKHTIGRAALGAALGAVGGRTFRDALAARRGTPPSEVGAAPVLPVEERGIPAKPRLVEPEVPAAVQEATPAPERQRLAPRPGGLPVEPPVRPDDYANFAKFDLDPTGRTRLEAEVERVVTETGVHPKRAVSWEQVRRSAAQLGLDVNAEGTQVNRRISGARLLAIRNIISANIDRQEKWAGELADATITPARRAQLDRMNSVLDAQNSNLLSEFVTARSAAGRELNALKLVASRSLDPNVWWLKARQLANRDLTTDELTDIRRLLSERDRAGLVSYVARLRDTPVSEQLTTLWKAGLLTNPKTHLVNITGNTAMAALETAKDPVAAGADWLLSLWTQQRTKGGVSRLLWETSRHAVRRGFAEASEVLKGRAVGEDLERGKLPRETTIDLPGLSPGANALLDGYQRYIFRALGAADRVYYHMAVTRSLTEQAVLAGRKMGMRGVVLRDYVHGILRGQGSMADEMTATALKDAAVATFRDQTRLGKAATAFARDVPGGQFIVPFQRTPGAVATRILEYSPLGLGKGVVDGIRAALKGGNAPVVLQRMAAEELGRGATGSGLIYLGYWLAQHGLMSSAAATTE